MSTVSYVLNKRSKVLHRLPASESCNTDAIKGKKRFEIHVSETMLMIGGEDYRPCIRCFPDDEFGYDR